MLIENGPSKRLTRIGPWSAYMNTDLPPGPFLVAGFCLIAVPAKPIQPASPANTPKLYQS